MNPSPSSAGASPAGSDNRISVGASARATATSFRLSILNWIQVASMYVPYVLGCGCVAALSTLLPSSMLDNPSQVMPVAHSVLKHVSSHVVAYAVLALTLVWMLSKKSSVYLVDFATYTPPADWAVTKTDIIEILRRLGYYSEDSLGFMARLLERSGTGEDTHWPASTVRILRAGVSGSSSAAAATAAAAASAEAEASDKLVADTSMTAARETAEAVMFGSVSALLEKTGVRGSDIDFLVVNCSLFCPTPSLASSVVKKFGMRPDVRSYNLGGMGCSAGLISIDLAKQLLENKPNSRAIVISFEDITQQLYMGAKKSMLLQNTLFRVGGAAILLSNTTVDAFRAKYKLLNTVRVQDTSDVAHGCVFQRDDEHGNRGIELTKEITTVAAKTLRDNLTILGPHVLPLREQIKVVINVGARKLVPVLNKLAANLGIKSIPGTSTGQLERPGTYVPDFKLGIHHFCIHAGGRAVIDGIEESLKLQPHHTAPSRATLEHWGNTSSSSIWYELSYVEGAEERFRLPGAHPIKRGERVLQIAFGSGFKCNSAVWLRLR